jgi:nucleoside-diphosphate-sugar epimerase
MKVLVTGSDGYIGAVLGPTLLEREHEVLGIDCGFYRDGWLFDDRRPRPRTLSADIRQLRPADVQGFDAVVHLAELSNDPLGALNAGVTRDINYHGSVRLAKTCKAAGVARFIYTSSCSVYGAAADGEDRDERSPTNPLTTYALCKTLVERDVAELADAHFSPVFLRNATAFGASPRMRFDIVLNNLAGLAWATKEIGMTSDGTPWRPLVHVADICEAVALVLDARRESVHNEIFNVGDDLQNYRVREIAEIVAEVFQGCALSFGPHGGDNRSYRTRFDKIKRHLPEFRCRRSAMQGAGELYEIFSRIGMTKEVFSFRAFTRLEQLKHLLATRQIDTDLFWPPTAAQADDLRR